jgi:hypothetical protein
VLAWWGGFMPCRILNDISDDWVKEKLNCINPNEKDLERRIEQIVKSKFEDGPKHFTPNEFSLFLQYKGLARLIEQFIHNNPLDDVIRITSNVFANRLGKNNFDDTKDQLMRGKILDQIGIIFYQLQNLDFVGPAVASACIAFCFPNLCGTADYIVPAMLHNQHDCYQNINPLYLNPVTTQKLEQALIMPIGEVLTAFQTRNMAILNYLTYIQELWNIKQLFELSYQVKKIEMAFWSFGICFIKKGRDNNNRPNDNRPLTFNINPNPPRGGPFSKPMFNPNTYCVQT